MRLNKLYRPAIPHEEIIAELRPVLGTIQKIVKRVKGLVISAFEKSI